MKAIISYVVGVISMKYERLFLVDKRADRNYRAASEITNLCGTMRKAGPLWDLD